MIAWLPLQLEKNKLEIRIRIADTFVLIDLSLIADGEFIGLETLHSTINLPKKNRSRL
jgi:hypothetical protein